MDFLPSSSITVDAFALVAASRIAFEWAAYRVMPRLVLFDWSSRLVLLSPMSTVSHPHRRPWWVVEAEAACT